MEENNDNNNDNPNDGSDDNSNDPKKPSDDNNPHSVQTGSLSSPSSLSSVPSTHPLLFEFIREKGFDIKEKIGGGHFGSVYRATWTKMPNIDIACKRIEINEVDKEWKDNCLKQEMIIMKKLKHKHIVEVFDVIKTRTIAFIFMELAENGTIKELMEKEKFPYKESRAKIWFKQIIDGLSYMHNKGIAHRDLKLENFLLNKEWDVLISDFGFACITYDRNSKENILFDIPCGSPSYMAPEVHIASKESTYDAKLADIYSLGVCLFEMINYDKPFSEELAETDSGLFKLVELKLCRSYRYHSKIEKKISNDIKDLIHKLLEPEPQKRITVEEIISHSAFK